MAYGDGTAGTPSNLKSLLAQTRKLQSTVFGADVDESFPTVRLGLDQIESQSRRLRAKATHQEGPDASDALSRPLQGVQTAHYLLAGGGINADELGRNIRAVDLKGTFEPLQPLHDADLEVRMSSLASRVRR